MPTTTFSQLFISVAAVLVSAMVGGLTAWVALRKRIEEESLGRASRKTLALQLLSDEEFTLESVRDECVVMSTLVSLADHNSINGRSFLKSETDRVKSEATAMLLEVRERRKQVDESLATMSQVELEAVIASAYHGKRRAEAQLQRTRLSRTETLKAYGVYEAHTSANRSDA